MINHLRQKNKKFFRRLQKLGAFILCIMLFAGCAQEEYIDINGWKEELVELKPQYTVDELTGEIEESASTAASLLGGAAQGASEKAQSLGTAAASLLKNALNQSVPAEPSQIQTDNTTDTSAPNAGTVKNNRICAKLLYVVDGDTIIVEYEKEEVKVRLIGINTPESVASEEYLEKTGKENTQEGKEASEYVKELLKDVGEVWLEFDEDTSDDYGRLLAYVWMNSDSTSVEEHMLNGIILKNGWAELMNIEPNSRYKDVFSQIVGESE